MQPASATFVPSPPQNGYQPLSEAEIYAIKRQYLGLLPPQQVIDICLTFEANAPLHVKSSVWPYDIRAAIASIQAQKTLASTSSESEAPSKTSAPDVSSSSEKPTTPPQTSPSQQSTPTLTQAGVSASSHPVASQPQASPATPGSHYSHQTYYHPTYPHAPYYSSPHAPYGYPHPYPSYLQPPAMYPVNPATQHPPLFTSAPLVHPPHPAPEQPPSPNNVDDLPSYEEMIVKALLDSGDPEGCAPKNLFSWMAMHYPLQMNFRPSASQALQKAYKRGRLSKGSNGKYRLNENWEGGNTSRRTTRRPQTLAHSTLPGPHTPSSSPFTHAPLAPHGATSMQARLPPPGQPPGYVGYPFGYLYSAPPGSAPTGMASHKLASSETVDHEIGEGSDAWEAAQNILKAINFGQLFQISNEENKAGEPPTSANSFNQQAGTDGSDKPLLEGTMVLEQRVANDTGKSAEPSAEQRAALQARLALLAAQLAELADVSEDELSQELSQKTATVSDAHTSRAPDEGSGLGGNSDNDGDEDMIEVPVPVASLTA